MSNAFAPGSLPRTPSPASNDSPDEAAKMRELGPVGINGPVSLTSDADAASPLTQPPTLADIAPAAVGVAQGLVSPDAAKALSGVAQGMSAVQAFASGDSMGAAMTATQMAGLADPRIAEASQMLSQVASLAGSMKGTALPDAASPAFQAASGDLAALKRPLGPPDDHPLTGTTIAENASPAQAFAPPIADEAASVAEEFLSAGILEDKTRLMRLIAPLKGQKRLYVASMTGSASLSDLSRYQLQLLSRSSDIELKEVLGKNLTVMLKLADGSEHPINGYVSSFGFASTDGGLAVYTAELVPWMWYLSKRVNSRIFQDVTALDVIAEVLKDYGSLPDYQVRVIKQPPVQNYVAQYGESDLNFVCRLLEQYGLFFFFEHRSDGHQLIICDDSTQAQTCPPSSVHPKIYYNDGSHHTSNRDELSHISSHRDVQVGAVALNTYDFKSPTESRYVEMSTVTQQGDVPVLQEFDGTPAFAYKDTADGNRQAKLRMEAYEWQAKQFFAQSDCRALIPGHTFKLLDHQWFDPSDEEDFDLLVVGVQIDARNNFGQPGHHDAYTNSLTLIRRKVPYRPMRLHPKPVMKGPQSATVVGPKGQEIHTDRYGRIKVQFPWDRYGKFDDGSSCWIRVSQPWAGRGWGTVAIPRIGQEIIVDFLDGDPDRPVCVGRLFNAEQTPPRGLPEAAHTMGFISNSTPGGGGQCRMLIKDSAGEELIDLFSQKDMEIETLNNQTTIVRGPQQVNVVTTGKQLTSVYDSIFTRSETSHICTVAETAMLLAAKTDAMGLNAMKRVEIESQSEHVVIRAKTAIRLEVGSSSLELLADGSIKLNGKQVSITGTDSIHLND